jgi:hypothetical protein
MLKVLNAAAAVDAGAVAIACGEPEQIKEKVFEARLEAVKDCLLVNSNTK